MEAAAGAKAEVATTEDGTDEGGNPSKERDMDESCPPSFAGLDAGILAGTEIPRAATHSKKASALMGTGQT